MIKRNVTTSFMVVAAGVLMFSGVALARNQAASGDKTPVVVSQSSDQADDNSRATSSPELQLGDDKGVDATAEPTADDKGVDADATAEPTLDDKGGHGADDATSPTAAPTLDDKGGHGADDTAKPTVKPTATPDDKGGQGGHGADDTGKPTATPAATDDKGGHGGNSH
jgi:hypothetical protein